MVLFWLRLYLTTEAVGCFFGLDKSNVSRNGRRLLAVLRQVSDTEFEWPEPPLRGQGRSVPYAAKIDVSCVSWDEWSQKFKKRARS